ncbi:hypothetical protein GCM10023238_05880 [Streptomyces heliomycini]
MPAEDPTGAGQSGAPSRQVTVKEGDGVLTEGLMSAIKRWQKAVGVEPTGVLESSDVVVTRSAVRVSEVSAQTGDAAASDLLSVTATTKSVHVPVETLDLGTIKAGQKVTVVLPDGTETAGEVATIGTTIKADQEGESGTGSNQDQCHRLGRRCRGGQGYRRRARASEVRGRGQEGGTRRPCRGSARSARGRLRGASGRRPFR